MAERRKTKLRVKISQIFIFDSKLRFALLASLCSAIFSEIENDNKLVTLPAGVNQLVGHLIFAQNGFDSKIKKWRYFYAALHFAPPFLAKK
jgi:hypothetical protein